MPYYMTFGTFQAELKDYYKKTGKRLQYAEALDDLQQQGKLLKARPPLPPIEAMINHTDPDSFETVVEKLAFPVSSSISTGERVWEDEMFPSMRDVFIIRHPRYTRPYLHRHDYMEINCVLKGSCVLHFEEETRTLRQGALCLIAPNSLHDIEITDDSTVYCIMLRRSTFAATFFSLLSREDALSLFFRTVLHEGCEPNYLIFQADQVREIQRIVQNAMLECFRSDSYSNSCCISYVNLLFACYLRSAGDSPQFYHYQMSSDFSLILHSIRHNYRTLTLSELAQQFNYSKPHLCTLIKQNTGVSFTELIKQIRMARAVEYLLHTELPIGEIAEIVGYHSTDHFSRVFRGAYSCSPQEYRRKTVKSADRFIPFEMK